MRADGTWQAAAERTSFSIVICTDNRAEALRNTLCSLGYLDYDRFEVCVVHGPSEDGTRELLAEYAGRIKVASNPLHNLAISRNIGIALASGDVVAFIDDDSIPEPEWLADLAPAYADPQVGGAGGFVYDHLGTGFQARYATADRLGRARDWLGSVTHLSFPFTDNFPHLLGTNSTFRRAALLEIGGFDEEFDYYLDETDVCARLVDAGWVIATITGAYVHHKFWPSSLRTVERGYRVLQSRLSVIKNKIYFSLKNKTAKYGFNEIVKDAQDFIEQHARDVDWLIAEGLLPASARNTFWHEVDEAWAVGLVRGLSGERRLLAEEVLERWESPFLRFPRTVPAGGRRTYCFVSQEYTQGKMGGIGRYTQELATSIAAMGHHVHVIARPHGDEHDRVDYERGVWVHRVSDRPAQVPQPPDLRLPANIWNHATTVVRTLEEIATKRPITAVSAPIWDCEGIAILVDGRFPLVTTLHTSMAPYLAANPSRAADRRFVRDFARPMIAAETKLMRESNRVIANSRAILDEMETMYSVGLAPTRTTLIPHGLTDWTLLPRRAPSPLPAESLRLVFVGRLEERKGTDVLLACAPRLLARYPYVYLDLVGNDTIPGPQGRTFREVFEADPATQAIRDRVRFHGSVSDEELRGFYQACDIFVAPSRFESFGLMLLEAMMFGKPVIGCAAGGMVEVVDDGVNGLLARAGDVDSLETCLDRLIADETLCASLGAAARLRYETQFTAQRMASAMMTALNDASITHAAIAGDAERGRDGVTRASQVHASSSEATLAELAESKRKVVIVAPMLARNDAISAAVRDTYHTLRQDASLDTAVLACRNDFQDVPAQLVTGLTALLVHPAFLDADLLIYHFGVYHELFGALIVGNRHARQVVVFHNVTPLEFAARSQTGLIEASFRQVTNLAYANEIWAVSDVNKQALQTRGISEDRVHVIPLVVEQPELGALGAKPVDRIELLFVGRAVRSKGLLDLVQALDLARRQTTVRMRLRVAGSLEWSDKSYLDEVRAYIRERGLQDVVQLCGAVDDLTRDQLYCEAHILAIPSYHEGFCKPVVEGLRAGCIPVGYAAFNTPFVAGGLGRLVGPGDIVALAEAITHVAEGVQQAVRTPELPALPLDRGATSLIEFDSRRAAHVETFAYDRVSALTRFRVHHLLSANAVVETAPTRQKTRVLATIGVGEMAPILEHARPQLEEYARRHGYRLVIGDGEAAGRPPAWGKVLLLRRLLDEADEVLWIDADAVILDPSVDLASQVDPSAYQALVRHWTNDGEVPNTGVWYLRGGRAKAFLDAIWQLDQYTNHNWWENAAALHLLGYSRVYPIKQVEPSMWLEGTQWLAPEWNAVAPWVPIEGARIRHYAGWKWSGLTPQDVVQCMRADEKAARLAQRIDYHQWSHERIVSTLESIYKRIGSRDGFLVHSGPFAGMRYIGTVEGDDLRRGSAIVPKLVGSYELELQGVLESLIAKGYERVINVGCGEGYYAVGLAMRLRDVHVFAFELDERCRQWAEELAQMNAVSDRITFAGRCSPAELQDLITDNSLLFVDCEGDEIALLDLALLPDLAHHDIVVEFHDFIDPAISRTLRERFAATHDVVVIDSLQRNPAHYPMLRALTEQEQHMAIDEFRPAGMQWGVMRSRSSGVLGSSESARELVGSPRLGARGRAGWP